MSGEGICHTQDNLDTLRVELLYKQSAIAQAAGLINAGIYLYLSKEFLTVAQLIWWGTFVLSAFLGRVTLYTWFNVTFVERNRRFNPFVWENIFAFGALISGISWALAGTLLLPFGELAHQAFLGFLLAGTTAGAAVAYCTSMKAIQAFLIPATLPFALTLIFEGGSFPYAMATLLILYILMISILMFRMNRYVLDSIRLRFEKDRLLHELRETQEKIVQSAKMASLGVMAGGIAHEINSPLTSILFESTALRERAGAGGLSQEMVTKYSDRLETTVHRIAKIITGLRTFSREDDQESVERVPLNILISETLDLCHTRFTNSGISLIVPQIQEDFAIYCRRVQISQILLNLLNNAFDALEGRDSPWVRIEVQEHPDTVSIAIVDNGAGIPADVQSKIMQPFFTTKAIGKGTGLGLSIAYGIARAHSGSLILDTSNPYTRFVLTLSRSSTPA